MPGYPVPSGHGYAEIPLGQAEGKPIRAVHVYQSEDTRQPSRWRIAAQLRSRRGPGWSCRKLRIEADRRDRVVLQKGNSAKPLDRTGNPVEDAGVDCQRQQAAASVTKRGQPNTRPEHKPACLLMEQVLSGGRQGKTITTDKMLCSFRTSQKLQNE